METPEPDAPQPEPEKRPSAWARLVARWRRLSRRQRTVARISASVLGLLILMAGSAEYTSRPSFCTTCHYMEPFYESWQASEHADVTCTKCHFPPGIAGTIRGKVEGLVQVANYVTSSYTRRKPWAEIDDASCLQSGCHATRLLEDSVAFQGVTFGHEPHLSELRRGKTLRCTSCHSQIVQGDHMVVTETSCFLCHFKESDQIEPAAFERLSSCQTCHKDAPGTGPSEFAARFDHTPVVERGLECTQCHNRTITGDGFVPTDNCFACHFEPEHLDRYEDTDFLHAKHITENKIECTQCHLRIQHKIERLTSEGELTCATCHAGTHREQLLLFTGTPSSGSEGIVNPMFEAGLDCASCHVYHEQLIGQASVRGASSQSCEQCHGEGYDRLLRLWQESSNNQIRTFQQAVRRVENGLRSAPADVAAAVQPLVDDARSGMHIVEVGGAVHNVLYADQLLRTGLEHLQQAVDQANLSVTLPAFEASRLPGECANCHTGIETIARPFNGSTFSHETHVVDSDVACSTCHSNARTHGELTISTASCNSCHHQPPALDNCASCHEEANAIYTGTFLDADEPDYMAAEDVGCVDCHVADRAVVRPDVAICVDCHDEEYQEMGAEWQTDVRAALDEVRGLLQQLASTHRNDPAYQQATTVVRQIEKGGAGGLHNYELLFETLDDTKSSLEALGN